MKVAFLAVIVAVLSLQGSDAQVDALGGILGVVNLGNFLRSDGTLPLLNSFATIAGSTLTGNGLLGLVQKTANEILTLISSLLSPLQGALQGDFNTPAYADKGCSVIAVKLGSLNALQFLTLGGVLRVVAKVDVSCLGLQLPAPAPAPSCLAVADVNIGLTNLFAVTVYCNFLPNEIRLALPLGGLPGLPGLPAAPAIPAIPGVPVIPDVPAAPVPVPGLP